MRPTSKFRSVTRPRWRLWRPNSDSAPGYEIGTRPNLAEFGCRFRTLTHSVPMNIIFHMGAGQIAQLDGVWTGIAITKPVVERELTNLWFC